jgi:hypothetical protein
LTAAAFAAWASCALTFQAQFDEVLPKLALVHEFTSVAESSLRLLRGLLGSRKTKFELGISYQASNRPKLNGGPLRMLYFPFLSAACFATGD